MISTVFHQGNLPAGNCQGFVSNGICNFRTGFAMISAAFPKGYEVDICNFLTEFAMIAKFR